MDKIVPRLGVVTVSDSRDGETDQSGPAVIDALREVGYEQFEMRLVKDDLLEIQAAIISLMETCQAIFTTGGTGFSPRDVTPEATLPLLEKRADGLVELIRMRGLEHTPLAHLSRAVAGVAQGVLIVNLPGSPRAARQGIEAIRHLLNPILSSLIDQGCPHV